MGLRTKKLLAIDWDQKNLRMAVVRPRGEGIELLKAVSVPITPDVAVDDAESFGAFLREAMKQSKIGAKQALVCIPREQVVLNTLNLPPTPPEEMPAIVQFQIVKELPFAADQATIDFAVGGFHNPKEPCSALVAAIRDEDLTFYRKTAQEAGLSLARIGLRPHANLRAVTANMPDTAENATLIVEVGPMLTEIDIVQDGALVFSRAASAPLPNFNVSETDSVQDSRIAMVSTAAIEDDEVSREAINSLMVDVIRSFEAYRATQPSAAVDQIVVCGATGLEAKLAESLAARFAARAELFSPERALELTPQRARELCGFSAVLGLAMAPAHDPIESFDFLNPKKPVSRRSLRLKKAPTIVLAAMFLIAAGVAYHYKFIQPVKAEIAKVKEDVDRLSKRKKALKDFEKKVKAIETWRDSEENWPLLLVELTRLFPDEKEAYVTRIDFRTLTQRRSDERLHELSIRFRESEFGLVHKLTPSLRELGLEPVKIVSDTMDNKQGNGPRVYVSDARIDAGVPPSLLDKFLECEANESDDEADSSEKQADSAAPKESEAKNASPAVAKPDRKRNQKANVADQPSDRRSEAKKNPKKSPRSRKPVRSPRRPPRRPSKEKGGRN